MHLRWPLYGRCRGSRVKFSHDRVTVKRLRNAECGMRIEKSEIQDPRSKIDESGACLRCYCRTDVSRQSIAGRHGDFRMPCFSCRFGEGSRAFDLGLRNGEYGFIREPCREYLMKR